jgi:hypothetical protein
MAPSGNWWCAVKSHCETRSLRIQWQALSGKDQLVNIVGFMDHVVSVVSIDAFQLVMGLCPHKPIAR